MRVFAAGLLAAGCFFSKLLAVLHDGPADEFIKAAEPLQFVFQLRVGENPFALPVLYADIRNLAFSNQESRF
jgi:hypothetical protein